MGSNDAAPWFYRSRFAVFGWIYGCACFFGFLITGRTGMTPLPLYRLLGQPLLWAGIAVLLVLGGLVMRVWGSSYLSSSVMQSANPQGRELHVSGPFRFTRNPLYFGNVLQAIGIGLVTPWLVSVLIVGGVVAFNYALISVEEPFLSRIQGEAYDRYRALVPQLIPIPGRSAPDGGQLGSLREGLRAEIGVSFLALAIFIVMLVVSIR